MYAAVIFSPGAGQRQKFNQIGRKIAAAFAAENLVTCAGSFGSDYLPHVCICEGDGGGSFTERLFQKVSVLLMQHPDLLICVGGDGIASYVADAMLTGSSNIPMMGIAAGTANIGPIIRVSPEELASLNPSSLEFISSGAVEVIGKSHVGFGFNDIVIGNTFLGTQNEKIVNLSVSAMLEKNEKKAVATNGNITSQKLQIKKNHRTMEHSICNPKQIIVSPLEQDHLAGRAVFGAACSAAYTPYKAVIALLDRVMISEESENAGIDSFCPVEHLLFGPDDTVSLDGLTENAQLVLDGNPYLRDSETVTFRYRPNLITVAVPKRVE